MAQFYLAIGSRFGERDYAVARLVGQDAFLVPAGTAAAWKLRQALDHDPSIRVVIDSGAWPPGNPNRLSLEDYWTYLRHNWRRKDGTWLCDWFASHDVIGDPHATSAAYHWLLRRICDDDPAAPLVPVVHYPQDAINTMLYDVLIGDAGQRFDVVDSDGFLDRPGYALGGMVPARYDTSSACWFESLMRGLEAAAAGDEEDFFGESIDPTLLRCHLFGIGRPSYLVDHIASFDSSGPMRMARFGMQKIHGDPARYGFNAVQLAKSREARLAFHLIDYREKAGLPWHTVDPDLLFADDNYRRKPALRHQLAFVY